MKVSILAWRSWEILIVSWSVDHGWWFGCEIAWERIGNCLLTYLSSCSETCTYVVDMPSIDESSITFLWLLICYGAKKLSCFTMYLIIVIVPWIWYLKVSYNHRDVFHVDDTLDCERRPLSFGFALFWTKFPDLYSARTLASYCAILC